MTAWFMDPHAKLILSCLIQYIIKYVISVLVHFEVLQGMVSVWKQMNLPLHHAGQNWHYSTTVFEGNPERGPLGICMKPHFENLGLDTF